MLEKINSNNISQIYNKIYKIVFYYSVYVILAVFASILTYFLLSKQNYSRKTPPKLSEIENLKYKGNFEKIMDQKVKNPDIRVLILKGKLQENGNIIQSVNNLLAYKGIVLPKNFNLDVSQNLQEISYSQKENYDINFLKGFVENVIMKEVPIKSIDTEPNSSILISENIIYQFNLECAFKSKFLQGTCQYYISKFLENFFIYDLSSDYEGLYAVFDTISNNKLYKKSFCESLKKYVLYSEDTSLNLEGIFQNCGVENYEQFRTIQEFTDIQTQLKKGTINSNVYFQEFVNEYKLFSIQQLIYSELAKGRINDRIIYVYFGYLQNLLKKDSVSNFYKDEIYWFNNYYLKEKLLKQDYLKQKDLIDYLLNEVNTINKGNKLIGFVGLNEQVFNKTILVESSEQKFVIQKNSITDLIKQLDKLSFFASIEPPKISGNRGSVLGKLFINQESEKIPLLVTLSLLLEEDILLIENIKIPEYPELEKELNKKLGEQKMILADGYILIDSIANLYLEKEKTSLGTCEVISNTLTFTKLVGCTGNLITIERKSPELKYIFKVMDGEIKGFKISDLQYQTIVSELVSQSKSDSFTLPNEIKKIVEYPLTQEENDKIENEKNLIIIDVFRNNLGVVPYAIKESESGFWVDFKINDFDFRSFLSGTTITELYLNDVSKENGDMVKVKNFQLELNEKNKTEINSFVLAPEYFLGE